jgi:hypothetical protein
LKFVELNEDIFIYFLQWQSIGCIRVAYSCIEMIWFVTVVLIVFE